GNAETVDDTRQPPGRAGGCRPPQTRPSGRGRQHDVETDQLDPVGHAGARQGRTPRGRSQPAHRRGPPQVGVVPGRDGAARCHHRVQIRLRDEDIAFFGAHRHVDVGHEGPGQEAEQRAPVA
ncbi:MAG: hypothetical protein ACK56I_10875, partial [bacterium]